MTAEQLELNGLMKNIYFPVLISAFSVSSLEKCVFQLFSFLIGLFGFVVVWCRNSVCIPRIYVLKYFLIFHRMLFFLC